MEKPKQAILIYLAVFVPLFVWGFYVEPSFSSFFNSLSLKEPWPLIITLDFMFGLLLLAIMIYLIEGSLKKAVIWGVLMLLIGNIVSAIYLLLNFDKIRVRLGARLS